MKLETAKRIQKYYEWGRITLLVIILILLAWAAATVK